MPLRPAAVCSDDKRVEEPLRLCTEIGFDLARPVGQLALEKFLECVCGVDVFRDTDPGGDLPHGHERDVVNPIAHVGAQRWKVQRFRSIGCGSRFTHQNASTTGRRSAGIFLLHSGM